MPELEDIALLKQFAENDSEPAFDEVVSRHLNLVYSTALRSTGDTHAAQEISQAVFIILARKAKSLGAKTILSGWLYQTTRLTAANFLRSEIRRQNREQEAFMQSTLNETESEAWLQIAPLLDDALSKLGARDRDAIVLRFFENKNLREIGAALGASEDAAKMRVNRALEKLRKIFTKRGIALSSTIIAGTVSANSVHAAPVGLAATISATAVKSSAVAASTLTLVKGALKLMAWTKMKTAVMVGAGILLAAGTTALTVKEIQDYKNDNYPWQVENPTPDILDTIPRLVKIVPTKFPNKNTSRTVTSGPSSLGIGVRIQDILAAAYNADNLLDGRKKLRMLLLAKVSPARYDYIANLKFDDLGTLQQELEKQSSGNVEVLQQELKKQFGLVGRHETIVTNVLLLKVKYPDSSGLKPVAVENQISPNQKAGEISFQDQGCKTLASALASDFRMPVLDETGLTNHYYYDLKWNPSGGQQQNQLNLKQALIDQLGLEVVPSRAPIEFLVVEKSN